MEFSRKRYIDRLGSMRWNGLVKVITGARRVGKSYILNKLFYEFLLNKGVKRANIIRFAFDSDEDIDRLEDFANGEAVRIKDPLHDLRQPGVGVLLLEGDALPGDLQLALLVGGLLDAVAAGLAQRGEDLRRDPLAELLCLRLIAPHDERVEAGFGSVMMFIS